MTADELMSLLAAAAPGTRVTLITIEVPAAPASEPSVPKPWLPAPGVSAQAPAIAARLDPFTCGELAEVLRVKSDTVSHWCRTGILPGATKAGGAGWRIPPSAVLAMLAGSGANGATDVPLSPASPATTPSVPAPVPAATANGMAPDRAAQVTTAGNPDDGEAFDLASLDRWRARRAGEGA